MESSFDFVQAGFGQLINGTEWWFGRIDHVQILLDTMFLEYGRILVVLVGSSSSSSVDK